MKNITFIRSIHWQCIQQIIICTKIKVPLFDLLWYVNVLQKPSEKKKCMTFVIVFMFWQEYTRLVYDILKLLIVLYDSVAHNLCSLWLQFIAHIYKCTYVYTKRDKYRKEKWNPRLLLLATVCNQNTTIFRYFCGENKMMNTNSLYVCKKDPSYHNIFRD